MGGGEDKLDKAACTVVKGIASRDEYLFEVLNVRTVLFDWKAGADGFHSF